jgi:hypothetical protein
MGRALRAGTFAAYALCDMLARRPLGLALRRSGRCAVFQLLASARRSPSKGNSLARYAVLGATSSSERGAGVMPAARRLRELRPIGAAQPGRKPARKTAPLFGSRGAARVGAGLQPLFDAGRRVLPIWRISMLKGSCLGNMSPMTTTQRPSTAMPEHRMGVSASRHSRLLPAYDAYPGLSQTGSSAASLGARCWRRRRDGKRSA